MRKGRSLQDGAGAVQLREVSARAWNLVWTVAASLACGGEVGESRGLEGPCEVSVPLPGLNPLEGLGRAANGYAAVAVAHKRPSVAAPYVASFTGNKHGVALVAQEFAEVHLPRRRARGRQRQLGEVGEARETSRGPAGVRGERERRLAGARGRASRRRSGAEAARGSAA